MTTATVVGGRAGGPSQQLKRLQLVKHSHKNCHSYTEKKTLYPYLKRAALVADEKRIDHKAMSLAYNCYEGTAPEYLQELIP